MNGNIIGKYTEESRQIPRQKLSGKHTQWISGAEEKEKDWRREWWQWSKQPGDFPLNRRPSPVLWRFQVNPKMGGRDVGGHTPIFLVAVFYLVVSPCTGKSCSGAIWAYTLLAFCYHFVLPFCWISMLIASFGRIACISKPECYCAFLFGEKCEVTPILSVT